MSTPTRATVLALASRLEIDPRTAERILIEGPDAVRVRRIRERARAALAELGLPTSSPSQPAPRSEAT